MTGPELTTNTKSRVWQEIVRADREGEGVTPSGLAESTGVAHATVAYMLTRWCRLGHLAVTGKTKGGRRGPGASIYRMASAAPSPGGPANYRMWQAARGLGVFSPADIAAHASVDEGPVSQKEAHSYCRMLLAAGYLRVREKARSGERPARYKLVRNTGPQPPVKRRVTVYQDPNSGDVFLPEDLA